MSRVGAALSRLCRFALRQKRLPTPRSNEHTLETRTEASGRLGEELSELVREGEISPALARRIADELFEPSLPGDAPLLRDKAWRDCQAGRDAARELASAPFEDELERRLLARQWRSLFEDS